MLNSLHYFAPVFNETRPERVLGYRQRLGSIEMAAPTTPVWHERGQRHMVVPSQVSGSSPLGGLAVQPFSAVPQLVGDPDDGDPSGARPHAKASKNIRANRPYAPILSGAYETQFTATAIRVRLVFQRMLPWSVSALFDRSGSVFVHDQCHGP